MSTLGVFVGVFDRDRRLLFVRRNYGNRTWTLPGGAVEPFESPMDAGRRETLEETGLEIEIEGFVGVYARPDKDDITLLFGGRIVGGAIRDPNHEIAEIAFFGRDDAPNNLTAGGKLRVADAFAGVEGVFRIVKAASDRGGS